MSEFAVPGSAGLSAHLLRVCLFQILCALDSVDGVLSPDEIELRLKALFVAPEVDSDSPDSAPDVNVSEDECRLPDGSNFRRCCEAAADLRARIGAVDALIADNVSGWSLGRMGLVDRTIIRLAVYEGFVAERVPVPVAISEAVLLAREFGGAESHRFVNGALARIARAVRKE